MSESAPITPDERFDAFVRSRVGGVRVGRFEGLRAGEAIAAVRRVGLRPAPERVEGYELDLHGFVVGQEPAEGGELAVGDQVVLFVAAPSRARVASEETRPIGEEADAEAGTAGTVSGPDAVSLPDVDEDVDVEAFRVGEPGYADETVEVHELAPPADWPPELEEPLEEPEPDHMAERRDGRALIAAGLSWWRGLPAAGRWAAVGVAVCLVVIVLAAFSGHGAPAGRSSARRAWPAGRPVEVVPRPAASHDGADAAGGRPVVRAARCHGRRRRDGRPASRARVRVVYVSERSAASASVAASGRFREAPHGSGASRAESAEEHVAREFGSP